MQKDAETIKRELAMPFAPEDLEWRIQVTSKDKAKGLAVPYVTNRAIQDRLDDTVGPENWHNDFKPWHKGKKEAQICGISICSEERGEWITKWDGAEDSDIEPIKGGLSDSMKRAAVQWGIGRVLYKMNTVWVLIEQKGNSFVIKDTERSKLDTAYMDTLKRLGLKPAKAGGLQSQLTPTSDGTATQQSPAPANPPREQQAQNSSPASPQGAKAAPQKPEPEFTIENTRIQKGMSGVSTSLVLSEPSGKKALAFVQGSHPELRKGMGLINVKKELKKQDSVVFYLLNGYECLAEDAA